MTKHLRDFLLVIIFAIFGGCAEMLFLPVANESFYKANVATIEVHTLEYVRSDLKYEMEIFEKLVIEILKSKGYKASLGPRSFYDRGFLGTYAKNLISKTPADSVLIIDSYFGKNKLYSKSENAETRSEVLVSMNVRHYFYDHDGNRILTTPDKLMQKINRKANFNLDDFKYITREADVIVPIIFYETEDEFIRRVAKELTDNIPKCN